MKIYLVTNMTAVKNINGNWEIFGIYSSEEKANECLLKNETRGANDVIECELDKEYNPKVVSCS